MASNNTLLPLHHGVSSFATQKVSFLRFMKNEVMRYCKELSSGNQAPSTTKPAGSHGQPEVTHEAPSKPATSRSAQTNEPRTQTYPIVRTVDSSLPIQHPGPEPPVQEMEDRIQAWEAEALVQEIEVEAETEAVAECWAAQMLLEGGEDAFNALYERFVQENGEVCQMGNREMKERLLAFLKATGHGICSKCRS